MTFVTVAFLLVVPHLLRAEVPIITLDTLLSEGAYHFAQEGVDSYKALTFDEIRNHVIVGAKNHVFRLSKTLKKIDELAFVPNPLDIQACTKEHYELLECHHIFINQLYIVGEDLFLFGISAFAKPFSQRVSLTRFSSTAMSRILNGDHMLPSCSPHGPIANIFVQDKLFVGSALDKDSDDIAIVVRSITDSTFEPVRTKNDKSWLASPEFMGAFEEGEAVYFVFREHALEASPPEDDVKVLSTVGRVCKNDTGGKTPELKGNFVSFTKARLVCDEYDLVTAAAYHSKRRILYASFTSSDFKSTAVCLFAFSDIETAFKGKFRVHGKGEWKDSLATHPKTVESVEETCFGPRAANEAIHYHLMTEPIKAYCNKPHYKTTGGNGEIFTGIAFSKMKDSELYFADSKGKVWNFTMSSCTAEPLEMWELEATPSTATVNSISVQDSILILTDASVISIPFDRTSSSESNLKSARLLEPSSGSSSYDTITYEGIEIDKPDENPTESEPTDIHQRIKRPGSKASVIIRTTIFYFIPVYLMIPFYLT